MITYEQRRNCLKQRLKTRPDAESLFTEFFRTNTHLAVGRIDDDQQFIEAVIDFILTETEKHGRNDELNLKIGLPTSAEHDRLTAQRDRATERIRHRDNLIYGFLGGVVGAAILDLAKYILK